MEQTNMPVAYAAGYSLTASTTSTHRITLERRKYITAIEVHIPAGTGGPAWVRLTLERGLNKMTLAEGYLCCKGVIQGTGQLPLNVENANVVLEYTNTTAAAIIVDVNVWASDHIEEGTQPGWYYQPIVSWEQIPTIQLAGTSPAAGAEVAYTFAAGSRYRLVGLGLTFVADANVANRTTLLSVNNAGTMLSWQKTYGTVTAGQTAILLANQFAGTDDTTGTLQMLFNFGPFELPAGSTLTTTTTNIQVGDDYTTITLLAQRWPQ